MTITFERINRLDGKVHSLIIKTWRSSSLTSHLWPTVMVLSIENGFLKITNSIFRPNHMQDTKKLLKAKMFISELLHKKYSFLFFLKNCYKSINWWFPAKPYEIRQNVTAQNCSSQKDLKIFYRIIFWSDIYWFLFIFSSENFITRRKKIYSINRCHLLE